MFHDNSPETPEFADDVSRISLTSSEVQRMHKLQDKKRTSDEDDELEYLQDRWSSQFRGIYGSGT